MSFRFDPNEFYIAVEADLVAPLASQRIVMALDTASTQTVIDQNVLVYLGLDQSQPLRQFSVATANGLVAVEEFQLVSLSALGIQRSPIDIIAMDLQAWGYGGLLGKDFFRDRVLKIDFRNGTIEVS